MCWDDESEFGELVSVELETESVEKALSLTGVGPLTKLTLLEAESDSLVQLQLKICSFYNKVKKRKKKKKEKTRTNCCKKKNALLFFL